ncbi:hypothetical protein GCK32_007779 [Trichostrongylus colubriformis]|uniref:Mut7-C RNAse domain-containing protein n=1 Tax=Trichostrongylus colubriformis TaxID=6319 RepID=A0AAN8IX47_TRICO
MESTPSTETISSTATADEVPRKLTKAEKKALYRPAHAEPLETRRRVLKDVYMNEKNESLKEELLTSILFSIFEIDENPYVSMLQLHKVSPDYTSNKPKSLAGTIVTTLHKWLLKRDDDVELFESCVTQELKMEAFRVATAKHTSYLKLFKEIFCLDDTELLNFIKEEINSMIDRHMFKEAMDVVEEFDLHHDYDLHAFVIPCLLQDKLSAVVKYIEKDRKMQERFVSYLDSFVGLSECDVIERLREYKDSQIMTMQYDRFTGKTIEKMIYRLTNELALSVESVAPNLLRARREGDLRFKAQSRFVNCDLNDDAYFGHIIACQSCTASQVSFDPSNGDPGRIDSDFRLETNDPATGCLRLTAICTAQAGFFSFMEFNVVEGGPAENQNMGQKSSVTAKKRERIKSKKERMKIDDMSWSEICEKLEDVLSGPRQATELQCIVDSMLFGLGKHMRRCGVNVLIPENRHELKCRASGNNRIILTSGKAFDELKQLFPTRVLCIPNLCSLNPIEQLKYVFSKYKVSLSKQDVFSRCMECNGIYFVKVPGPVIQALFENVVVCRSGFHDELFDFDGWSQKLDSVDPREYSGVGCRLVLCNDNGMVVECCGGTVDIIANIVTHDHLEEGVDVIVRRVPEQVVSRPGNVFFICGSCGKVYWDSDGHVP